MLIIPDTNFLIYLAKFRLWHELERFHKHSLLILPQVMHELETLAKKAKGKDKESSLMAIEIVDQLKPRIKSRKGYADKAILQIACWLKNAGERNFVIATMDQELRKMLKKEGIKLLTIRQKKHLVMG